MQITYDPSSQRAVVAFRGRITVLPETFETETLAISAGELHCRSHGWRPTDHATVHTKSLRTLF